MVARGRIAEPDPVSLLAMDVAARRRVSAPGLRTFVRIADRWGFSEAEKLRVLGHPGRSTYHVWIGKARDGRGLSLPFESLLRISAVLGILMDEFPWTRRGKGRLSAASASVVARELATLLRAGMPLDRSLEILIELDESDKMRRLGNVLGRVKDGSSLADAFAGRGSPFPGYFVSGNLK